MTSSHREALPTFPTPARDHRPAAFSSHANPEAVGFLPPSSVWLECPLHYSFFLTVFDPKLRFGSQRPAKRLILHLLSSLVNVLPIIKFCPLPAFVLAHPLPLC